ncbi:PR domain zinc finger protein 12-like [Apostichopus japonicus]|uniref:PR domain zinc finger protein 12-like n=1 Tax=Stichopus japonicus TaxID=307972 RepID=UPI003AB1BB5A
MSTQSITEATSLISVEMLRNALYSKWCNLAGKSMTQESSLTARRILESKKGMPMPSQVTLSPSSIPGSAIGVFTRDWIKEGTEMGPYTGRIVLPNDVSPNLNNSFMWEVYDDHGTLSHFVDASDEGLQTWMCFVNSARNDQEQNLEVVQMGKEIYYKAIKTIPPDQELLVYYGNTYEMFLGIPIGLANTEQKTVKTDSITATSPLKTPPTGTSRLQCVVCRRGFNSRSNLRSHMRIHTLEKPFVCKYCHRRFSQSSTLRNHVRLHTGEKPYRCNVCHSAYSQLAGLRAHQKSARHRPIQFNHLASTPGKTPRPIPTLPKPRPLLAVSELA